MASGWPTSVGASMYIRPVSRLLGQIVGGDGMPLDVARGPSPQVPGNCRHFIVLVDRRQSA